jgi:hypothetical protein
MLLLRLLLWPLFFVWLLIGGGVGLPELISPAVVSAFQSLLGGLLP